MPYTRNITYNCTQGCISAFAEKCPLPQGQPLFEGAILLEEVQNRKPWNVQGGCVRLQQRLGLIRKKCEDGQN